MLSVYVYYILSYYVDFATNVSTFFLFAAGALLQEFWYVLAKYYTWAGWLALYTITCTLRIVGKCPQVASFILHGKPNTGNRTMSWSYFVRNWEYSPHPHSIPHPLHTRQSTGVKTRLHILGRQSFATSRIFPSAVGGFWDGQQRQNPGIFHPWMALRNVASEASGTSLLGRWPWIAYATRL